MTLLLMTPEPEYKMSKLYVEVTSEDSVGSGFMVYYLFIYVLVVIHKG